MTSYKVGMILHSKSIECCYIKLHRGLSNLRHKPPGQDGWHVLQWSFRDGQWGYEYFETTRRLDEKFECIGRLEALIVLGCT